MTRKEEIEQEAKNYCKGDTFGDSCMEKPAFVTGAQWADKTMIEKASRWLKDNVNHFCYISAHSGDAKINEFVLAEEFEKAMEE